MADRPRFLERFGFQKEYLASRETKALKILRVLQKELQDLSARSMVDVGCSQGHISRKLADHFRFVVGVDPDPEGKPGSDGFHFIQADGCLLPLASSTFDVALLNHVLEHVPSAQGLLDEIWRVLKPGGICYLACPNRFSLVEPHYRLPFLSWLPRYLGNLYVRLTRRGNHYLDHLPSYWQIKRLTRRFVVADKTIAILTHPEEFFPEDSTLIGQSRRLGWLPVPLLNTMVPWLPVWILVMKKPEITYRDSVVGSSNFFHEELVRKN